MPKPNTIDLHIKLWKMSTGLGSTWLRAQVFGPVSVFFELLGLCPVGGKFTAEGPGLGFSTCLAFRALNLRVRHVSNKDRVCGATCAWEVNLPLRPMSIQLNPKPLTLSRQSLTNKPQTLKPA